MSLCIICEKPEDAQDPLRNPTTGLQTIKDYFQLQDRKEVLALIETNSSTIRIHKTCQKRIGNEIRKNKRNDQKEGASCSKMKRRSEESVPFDSKNHCLFCGKVAGEEEKVKHPNRDTSISHPDPDRDMKKRLLEICGRPDKINCEHSHIVRGRLMAIIDVVADNCRYHRACFKRFCKESAPPDEAPPVKRSGRPTNQQQTKNFERMVEWLELQTEVYTITELHEKMVELADGTDVYARNQYLKEQLHKRYGDQIFFADVNGKSDVACFKNVATSIITDHKTRESVDVEHQEGDKTFNEETCSTDTFAAASSIMQKFYERPKPDDVNRSVIFFTSDINDVLEEETTTASYIKAMIKVVNPIRSDMSLTENSFAGKFMENCQENSVPQRLLTLVSLLVDGSYPRNEAYSQSVKTISQLIMREYRQKPLKTGSTTHRRHLIHHETPIPTYVGLKLYATIRSRTCIDRLFHLGLCISYDRIISICNSFAYSMLKQFERNKVFVPSSLRLEVFTIIAKDNIDFNAKSTKASKNFHGISMTIAQLLTFVGEGKMQDFTFEFSSACTSADLQLPEEYVSFEEPPFSNKSDFFAPPANATISATINEAIQQTDIYNAGMKQEHLWSTEVSRYSSENDHQCRAWSKFHADHVTNPIYPPGLHALMPVIHEKVATLKSQYNIMKIIRDTIKFINPSQVPVDASDCPVYALSKQVQMKDSGNFGNDKYVCLFGDLHIEIELLRIHGELIKGSGLDSILESVNLSTVGTNAIIDVNNNKRARYCLQVSTCALYRLLVDACDSNDDPINWLCEKSKTSEMCFYWQMILEYQLHVLLFIRSVREGNFELYKQTLYNSLKYFFAFDKYNYARWVTVYWFDLASMHLTCPEIYLKLNEGHFSFQKTNSLFSKIGIDQLHEQNNKVVKGAGGATSLINRSNESALNRWMLCGPELSSLLKDFEMDHLGDSDEKETAKHHEDNPKFRQDFLNDVETLYKSFPHNPFQLDQLVVVNKPEDRFDDNIYYNLSKLLPTGSDNAKKFIETRLIQRITPINSKITLNHFILPGSENSKTKKGPAVDKRLTSAFYTQLRAAITHRRDKAKLFFASAIYGYSQSLAKDSCTMYQGTKAGILGRFAHSPHGREVTTESSALILELSPILRSEVQAKTFINFAEQIYAYIMDLGKEYSRIDVICDRYFAHSLKNQTREGRGKGGEVIFGDNTAFPSDFRTNFLKNNSNKNALNEYLAQRFIDFHENSAQTFTVTMGNTILSNDQNLLADALINKCNAEEADQRLVRHMIQCVSTCRLITIRTVDTDVLLHTISNRHHAGNFESNVQVMFVTGVKTKYYDVNQIAIQLGEDVCTAIPFFHAFSGCDSVSYFFNHGKCKVWDRWHEFEEQESLTKAFCELSSTPESITSAQIRIIEKFVIFFYYDKTCNDLDLDYLRMDDFEHSTHNNLRFLPPCKEAMIEQIKRACYEGGWVSSLCKRDTQLPDPQLYGRILVNGDYLPKWQNSVSMSPEELLVICSCTVAKCLTCRCAKASLQCLPYCKCHRRCLYKLI